MCDSLNAAAEIESIDGVDAVAASFGGGGGNADDKSSGRDGGGGGAASSSLRRATLEPCVAGATIAQERKWLELIRLMALDVDDTTLLAPGLRATEFAFLYVREDRTKRQANIRRCKENKKQQRLQQEQQQEQLDLLQE